MPLALLSPSMLFTTLSTAQLSDVAGTGMVTVATHEFKSVPTLMFEGQAITGF